MNCMQQSTTEQYTLPPINPPPINHEGPAPSKISRTKVPKERSIVHDSIANGKAVFCSLDIETGGEDYGIVQFSVELVRIDIVPGTSKGKNAKISARNDTLNNVARVPHTFNKYVNPGETVIWSDAATWIHGLHVNHTSIIVIDPIHVVWAQFLQWIELSTEPDEVIVMVHGMV